jgi:hypothetical protein
MNLGKKCFVFCICKSINIFCLPFIVFCRKLQSSQTLVLCMLRSPLAIFKTFLHSASTGDLPIKHFDYVWKSAYKRLLDVVNYLICTVFQVFSAVQVLGGWFLLGLCCNGCRYTDRMFVLRLCSNPGPLEFQVNTLTIPRVETSRWILAFAANYKLQIIGLLV